MLKQPRVRIDFETRSEIKIGVGTWKYSKHPSTDVLCLVYRLPHWEPRRTGLWHPAFPTLDLPEHREDDTLAELFAWIASGGLLEAHNAFFERCIWGNIMVPRYQFPPIPHTSWRCSAAEAAACALPRGLDNALMAIGSMLRKDAEGSKVMKKMTKPRKPRKKEREEWTEEYGDLPHKTLYWESEELLAKLIDYCRQDVLAEDGLSYLIPELSEDETDLYLLDQRINLRGFQLDRKAVTVALSLLARENARLNGELYRITDGMVEKATQRQRLMAWFAFKDVEIPNTQAATIDVLLEDKEFQMPREVRRALEILRLLGRSSTAKYQRMMDWMDDKDHRVRGGLLFHGASTGRWSGSGIQPHNFPKGTVKDTTRPNNKVDIEDLWNTLKAKDRRRLKDHYHTTVMAALSHALRGTIVARPGYELFVADFAAIEARVLLWLAKDEDALNIFRQGKDIYCDMASAIYKYPVNKNEHPKERGMGKIAILGLGYQMGWAKFVSTCASYGIEITDEFSQTVVEAYREKYWRVKQLWYDQEAAAVKCAQTGKLVQCGRVTWTCDKHFLFCQLPSGRRIAYPDPEVTQEHTSWGELKDTLSYMAINSYTRQWQRQKTYGGMIVENIVQAIARDLLAGAMVRCEESRIYLPVLSVHDEVIAEAVQGLGTLHAFESLMKAIPIWARGCPIDVDAWVGPRYQKA